MTRVSEVSTRAALEAALDTYLAHNRPLLGWRGQPNLVRIARQIGYHRAMFRDPALRLPVESAAAVVGVAETAGFDLDIHGRLDGRPWIGQLSRYSSALTCAPSCPAATRRGQVRRRALVSRARQSRVRQ
ncbi:hypothetical protein ACIBJF_37370 [Streptomyces sp. NPDC050743]|uniref:hypothetical protein n=1 Tax=Streptomyces sp. NPDC050743 TaxID=3365634 RepID=UPI00379F4B94